MNWRFEKVVRRRVSDGRMSMRGEMSRIKGGVMDCSIKGKRRGVERIFREIIGVRNLRDESY